MSSHSCKTVHFLVGGLAVSVALGFGLAPTACAQPAPSGISASGGIVASHSAEVTVAVSGKDAPFIRIPALAITDRGTLLAFYEARATSGDSGYIRVAVKRSTDMGKTWSNQIVVADDPERTFGNPAVVVDRHSGRVVLLVSSNRATDNEATINQGKSQDTRRAYRMFSDDDGQTWTSPQEITSMVKPAGARWYATGPGSYEQLANGRMLVPFDMSKNHKYQNGVIYSDNTGASWSIGAINTTTDGNETATCQFKDGSVLLSSRQQKGPYRNTAITSDGGRTFSSPFAPNTSLVAPMENGGLLHYGSVNGADIGLFSIGSDPVIRKNGVVRMTSDKGRTWTNGTLVHSGFFGYSSMVKLPDGRVGLLFESYVGQAPSLAFMRLTIQGASGAP